MYIQAVEPRRLNVVFTNSKQQFLHSMSLGNRAVCNRYPSCVIQMSHALKPLILEHSPVRQNLSGETLISFITMSALLKKHIRLKIDDLKMKYLLFHKGTSVLWQKCDTSSVPPTNSLLHQWRRFSFLLWMSERHAAHLSYDENVKDRWDLVIEEGSVKRLSYVRDKDQI